MNVSIRDAILPVAPSRSLFDCLRSLQISAVELWVMPDMALPHLFLSDGSTPFSLANTAKVSQLLQDEGVTVSAFCLPTDFSGPDAAAHVDFAVRVTEAADLMAVPAVRIDTATANSSLSHDEVRANFIRRVGQVLQRTSASPVGLGIENHGHVSNNPEFLDGVFAEVGDDRLGMTLDTGNFYWFGYPLAELYNILEHFAPSAKHSHVKNINYPLQLAESRREIGLRYGELCCPLDEGNIEMSRVVSILKDAGYNADLCIENEALGRYRPEERMDVLKRDVDCLKATLKQI